MSSPLVDLGSLVSIKGGGTPSRKIDQYWNGSIPWATVKDFKTESLDNTLEFITDEGLNKSASNLIPANTLIIPTRMALGKVAINTIPMAINQDLKALFVNDDSQVNNSFLKWFLKSKAEIINSNGSGATVKGINLDFLRKIKVPLPPLDTQKRIVEILDRAQGLIDLRKQQIAEMDALVQSVFYEMFGDPVSNPKGWEVKKLGDVSHIVRGSSPRPKGDPRYYNGPVPRLMVQDVTRDGLVVYPRIDSLTIEGAKKSRFIDEGTVVMAVSGNVGVSSILGIDACIHDGFIAFKDLSNYILPKFLVFVLNILKVTHENRKAGAIFQNLTTTQIKEMMIPIPPVKKQEIFFMSMTKIDTQKKLLLESFEMFEMTYKGMMQRAFCSELL